MLEHILFLLHLPLLFFRLVARNALFLVNGVEGERAVVAGAAVLALLERGMGDPGRSELHAEQAVMAVLADVALLGVLSPVEQNLSLAASGPGNGLVGPDCRSIPRQDEQRAERKSNSRYHHPYHASTSP